MPVEHDAVALANTCCNSSLQVNRVSNHSELSIVNHHNLSITKTEIKCGSSAFVQ